MPSIVCKVKIQICLVLQCKSLKVISLGQFPFCIFEPNVNNSHLYLTFKSMVMCDLQNFDRINQLITLLVAPTLTAFNVLLIYINWVSLFTTHLQYLHTNKYKILTFTYLSIQRVFHIFKYVHFPQINFAWCTRKYRILNFFQLPKVDYFLN